MCVSIPRAGIQPICFQEQVCVSVHACVSEQVCVSVHALPTGPGKERNKNQNSFNFFFFIVLGPKKR